MPSWPNGNQHLIRDRQGSLVYNEPYGSIKHENSDPDREGPLQINNKKSVTAKEASL
jgi:hypothetical protein